MSYRNIILMGVLVLGVAIVVLLYVRRGFSDLQGQIDDIETMLASMPPALTSGAWAGSGGGMPAPPLDPLASAQSPEPATEYNLDDDGEGMDDDDEQVETLIETELPEYDLTGIEPMGIATLSEPGLYEAGGVQLEVTPVGAGEGSEYDAGFEVSELEPVTDIVQEGEEVSEDDALDLADAEVADADTEAEAEEGAEEGAEEEAEEEAEEFAGPEEPEEPAAEEDEYSRLTLPELKARLKVVQPETKGLARLKRAEVLDRLRSGPVEADSEK